ncbi:MAG TPA: DUF4136 domain-containing protein [Terriglobales bacterium]|nr:DUF4136 domain-containing protein [Terriglobales bacterium]
MKPAARRIAGILLCAAVLGLGARAQKVNTKFDESYDFSEHRNYKWRENRLVTQQNPDTNYVMDRKIVRNVNELLKAKGFTEVQEHPDFYLYYDGGGDMQMASGGASQAGSGPSTTADISPDWGLGNGPTMAPSTWLKVNGLIEFHMVDAKTKKVVWDTTYSKTFRDRDKALKEMDKEVKELVTKSFKEFPPKEKK